jgi:hypothetical protein
MRGRNHPTNGLIRRLFLAVPVRSVTPMSPRILRWKRLQLSRSVPFGSSDFLADPTSPALLPRVHASPLTTGLYAVASDSCRIAFRWYVGLASWLGDNPLLSHATRYKSPLRSALPRFC